MNISSVKSNKIALPVDFTGNAVQVFMLGGPTKIVANTSFIAITAMIRIINATALPGKIFLKGIAFENGLVDEGLTILPNSVATFGCIPGDEFNVTGTLEVTFIRDQSLLPG